jgi:hypothetical protein
VEAVAAERIEDRKPASHLFDEDEATFSSVRKHAGLAGQGCLKAAGGWVARQIPETRNPENSLESMQIRTNER